MEFSLRKAVKSDLGFLTELRELTMRKYLEEVGMPTTSEAYLNRILYEFEHAQIVTVNEAPAGLFKFKFNEQANEWYLIQIQIHPAYQNHKIASRLISALIEKADLTGSGVGLSVIKTNPAQHLYSRLGFVQVGENKFEYLMKYEANKIFKSDS